MVPGGEHLFAIHFSAALPEAEELRATERLASRVASFVVVTFAAFATSRASMANSERTDLGASAGRSQNVSALAPGAATQIAPITTDAETNNPAQRRRRPATSLEIITAGSVTASDPSRPVPAATPITTQLPSRVRPALAPRRRPKRCSRRPAPGINARRLHKAGHLSKGVTVSEAADVLWTYSAPELYELLVLRRRWSRKRYGSFVADAMIAKLL